MYSLIVMSLMRRMGLLKGGDGIPLVLLSEGDDSRGTFCSTRLGVLTMLG